MTNTQILESTSVLRYEHNQGAPILKEVQSEDKYKLRVHFNAQEMSAKGCTALTENVYVLVADLMRRDFIEVISQADLLRQRCLGWQAESQQSQLHRLSKLQYECEVSARLLEAQIQLSLEELYQLQRELLKCHGELSSIEIIGAHYEI